MPPDLPPASDLRARERQQQLEALRTRAADEIATAAVERVAGAGVVASVCVHVALVALGAWLMTRGGPLIGTYGAACLLVDAVFWIFALLPMMRLSLEQMAVRAVLVATSVLGAVVALGTLLASLVGKMGALPFQPLSLKGGVLILGMLLFLALYSAGSAWLAWLLGFHSAETLRKRYPFNEPD